MADGTNLKKCCLQCKPELPFPISMVLFTDFIYRLFMCISQVNAYRFSISWSRVLPDGEISNINEEGISYYNNLINGLIDAGIHPMVTMYHWDLPAALENKYGGWLNASMANFFEDYADLLYNRFGDRVM